jgi:hypothetical protein
VKTKALFAGGAVAYLWISAVLYARHVKARKIAARQAGVF